MLLGDAAVILHGMSRTTDDFDIWMDPTPLEEWASALRGGLAPFANLELFRLGGGPMEWKPFPPELLPQVALEDKVIRVCGAHHPLDVFYQPNETEVADFDAVWSRARPLDDGTRLMEEIDLLLTKEATRRRKDLGDIAFLEGKVDERELAILRSAGPDQAREMFARYATPDLLRSVLRAADHPDVRELARQLLRELGDDGDPFAIEYVREMDPEYRPRPLGAPTSCPP